LRGGSFGWETLASAWFDHYGVTSPYRHMS
jgi:hypothetical protein